MPRCYDFERGELGFRCSYGIEHVLLGFKPGDPEAVVGRAVCADGGGDNREVYVCDPVSHTAGAAEGDDDEVVGCVCCDEAGDVGDEAVFEFC